MVEFDVSLTRDMTPIVYHDLGFLYKGQLSTVNKHTLTQLQVCKSFYNLLTVYLQVHIQLPMSITNQERKITFHWILSPQPTPKMHHFQLYLMFFLMLPINLVIMSKWNGLKLMLMVELNLIWIHFMKLIDTVMRLSLWSIVMVVKDSCITGMISRISFNSTGLNNDFKLVFCRCLPMSCNETKFISCISINQWRYRILYWLSWYTS